MERTTLASNPTTLWGAWLCKGGLLPAWCQWILDPDLPAAISPNATFGCPWGFPSEREAAGDMEGDEERVLWKKSEAPLFLISDTALIPTQV